MKKFLIALSIVLLLVILFLLYELKLTNDKLLIPITWDNYETISQLEKELSIKIEELSGLQSENLLLQDTLSWAIESINSLQIEKSGLVESLSWCESRIEKYVEYIKELRETSNNSNKWVTNISNNNTNTINWKELWKISQVYTDENWNKKIKITYGGQLTDWATCGTPESPICLVNENPKTGTFTVSDNVQINTYTIKGYVEENKISFTNFEQKFKNTNNNDEYSYFKLTPFRITIENGIVVEIAEQYMP